MSQVGGIIGDPGGHFQQVVMFLDPELWCEVKFEEKYS